MKLYEYDCLNCGKHHIIPASSSVEPKFCDRECWREYNKKKAAAAEAAKAEKQKNSTKKYPLIPQAQCRKCKYGLEVGGYISCDYVFQTDISRVVTHLKTGMPTACEEFKKRARARKGKAGAENG